MLSSGKHSLTGGRRIPKSAIPSRSPLAGGEHQLPLSFASPEQARDGRSVPPTNPRSSEDSLRPHAQLRQTFPHRRKTNTEERNSVEKGAHRRRAPAPVKVCFAGAGTRWGVRTSDEPSVVGGQPASACSAPANIPSQEEDEYRRAQPRREARSPEESTSSR